MATEAMNTKKNPEDAIDPACVDVSIVDRFLATYGLDASGDTAEKVARLARHIKEVTPKEEIADCDNCKGESDVRLDTCPFCGIGGVEGPDVTAAPAVPVAPPPPKAAPALKAPKAPKATKANGGAAKSAPIDPTVLNDLLSETDVTLRAHVPEAPPAEASKVPRKRSEAAAGGKGKGKAAKPGKAASEPVAEVPEAPATPAEPVAEAAPEAPEIGEVVAEVAATPAGIDEAARKLAARMAEKKAAREAAPDTIDTTAEIIPAGGGGEGAPFEIEDAPTVYTEEALDAAVEGVRRAKTRAIVCYWELGKSILDCFRGALWKQRRDADDQPLYKSWSQFCGAELEMSPQYAYRMMDVAATFSRDDVSRFGVNKLGIMLRLSEAQRAKMLEEARAGMPYTELADQVRQLGPGARDTGRKQVGGGKGGRKATKPEVPANSVTVALAIGRVKVPLFARDAPGKKAGEKKRAMRLADDPCGEEILLNGVVQRFTLAKDSEGRLLLIVERRRVNPPAK